MLMRIVLSTKLVKDVKQTLGIPSETRFTALKTAVFSMQRNRDIPAGCRTTQHGLKENAHCFTLVSAIVKVGI